MSPQPKRRDRYSEHASRLARRLDELLTKTTTNAARAALETAYGREMATRAIKHHGRSSFAPPPRNELDEAGARCVMKAFYTVRDRLWRKRLKGQQRIPDTRRRVLKYLLNVAVKAGHVFPSHATIARHAGCCERTVRNALAWLRENDFLSWQRRLEWVLNALAQRVPRQTSNAYTLVPRGLEAAALASLNSETNGKKFRVAENPVSQLIANAAKRDNGAP